MKVLQINTWQGRLLRPLLAFIHDANADIVCAQEIYSYDGAVEMSSPWNYFGTTQLIASQNGYEHVYFSPSATFTMFGQTLGYGNAIFSKYPLLRQSTHSTGGHEAIHYDTLSSFGGNNTRNFQHVQIDTGRTHLSVLNHHAHWVNQPLGDSLSIERITLLSDYIDQIDEPIVVAGDFNLSPQSPAMRQFVAATKLVDLSSPQAKTTLSAAHFLKIPVVCDYLLASPSLKSQGTMVHPVIISDHLPVITEIDC